MQVALFVTNPDLISGDFFDVKAELHQGSSGLCPLRDAAFLFFRHGISCRDPEVVSGSTSQFFEIFVALRANDERRAS